MGLHRHNWDLIDKTVVEAPYSKLLKAAENGVTSQGGKVPRENAYAFFNDRVVLTFKCECGKVKVVEK